MQKIIGCFFFLAISATCFSQDSIKMKDGNMQDTSTMRPSNTAKNYLVMKNGQVMVIKAGKETKLQKFLTLSNGVTVMPDGKVTLTDGTTRTLNEGEWIDMNGKMGKGKMGDRHKDSRTVETGSRTQLCRGRQFALPKQIVIGCGFFSPWVQPYAPQSL